MTAAAPTLGDRVAALDWYHVLELPGGVVTRGHFDARPIVSKVPLPTSLAGKRCLDVGTWDGFWAFEMERRGAEEVVAVDLREPAQWDWPASGDVAAQRAQQEYLGKVKAQSEGFHVAREALGSSVDRREVSIYDLSPEIVGEFDFVFLGSLLLHLRDPVGALRAARSACAGELLLLDAIDPLLTRLAPRLPLAGLDGRGRPWWWWPNLAGLIRMTEAAGFEPVHPPLRLRMPPGRGQPRLPLRTLRTRAGRRAYASARVGDPHAALLLRPKP
jgi:tRNA (mo5U34)-methyltransferase